MRDLLTFYNNAAFGIQIYSPNTNAVVQNNLIIGSAGVAVDDAGTGSLITTNITAPQNFANAGAGDFHLLASSSAINAGATLSYPAAATDKDGIARPQPPGGASTLGAYEFLGGFSAPAPSPTNLRLTSTP